MMPDEKVGVITEQGYPVGKGFGFQSISEEDKEKMKDDKEDKK